MHKARRFTLIELLVVVAIIAIIAAMLLPALSRAKYEAKNVICIANLKSIAAGVTSYTGDYDDFYPYSPSEDNGWIIAPSIIAQANRGIDWRPGLTPYFGSTLKDNWICPLAHANYRNGAVRTFRNATDMDTTSEGVTSYGHFYGRTKENGTLPNADCYWGSGAARFYLKKGMKKLGQTQRFECFGGQYDDSEFRLLSADVFRFLWNMKWTHNTPGGFYNPNSGRDYYNEYTSDDVRSFPAPRVDFNFSTDDGAVQTLRKVGYRDTRITITSNTLERGWVIPLDAMD